MMSIRPLFLAHSCRRISRILAAANSPDLEIMGASAITRNPACSRIITHHPARSRMFPRLLLEAAAVTMVG